jgi:hypothetical protein
VRTNCCLAAFSNLPPTPAGEATQLLAQGAQLRDSTIHLPNLSQQKVVEVDTRRFSPVADAQDVPDLAQGQAQAFRLHDKTEASNSVSGVDPVAAVGAVGRR